MENPTRKKPSKRKYKIVVFFAGQVIANCLNKTEGGLEEFSTYRLLEIISDESSLCDKYIHTQWFIFDNIKTIKTNKQKNRNRIGQ